MTLEKLNVIISAETDGLNKALDKTKTKVANTNKETKKSTSQMGQAFSGLAKKFAVATLAVKAIEKAIQAVVKATKEGINNAYSYSKAMGTNFAKEMDSAKSSLTYFSNSLGAVFLPLLESVIPIFTKIVDAITSFNNKIAESIAIIQNKSSYTVAKKTAEQYEKLNKQTFGFDELNIVNSDSKKTQMFEEKEVDTSSKLYTTVEKIKKKFAEIKSEVKGFIDELTGNLNFNGVGERLKEAFSNIAPKIQETLSTVFGRSTDFLKERLLDISNSKTLSSIIDISPTFIDMLGGALDVLNTVIGAIWDDLEAFYNSVLKPIIDFIDTVVSDVLNSIKEWWENDGEAIISNVKQLITDASETVQYYYNEVLGPIIDNIKDKLTALWKEHIKPLFDNLLSFISPLIEAIKVLYENVLQPVLKWIMDKLVTGINNAIDIIWGVIEPIISGIIDSIRIFIDVLKGLLKFIIGVFTGDWGKAWDGIKDTFLAIWEGVKNSFKTTINFFIGLINGMLKAFITPVNKVIETINSINIHIPDWVPLFGGKSIGFNIKSVTIPQIPLLASGGIVTKSTLAMIGEQGKEAVLPLENNTEWIDKLAERITANTPSKVTLNVDGKQLGYAVINNINSITRQTGVMPLSLA